MRLQELLADERIRQVNALLLGKDRK